MNLQSFEKAQEVLQSAGNEVEKNLETIVTKLIDLVETGEVLQFTFDSNVKPENYNPEISPEKYKNDIKPALVLGLKLKGNQILLLGDTPSNHKDIEYTNPTNFGYATITEETKKDIKQIGEYVKFVNMHVPTFMPEIETYTVYSKKSFNAHVNQIQPVLPSFLEHLIPQVKVKKYPKGFKH